MRSYRYVLILVLLAALAVPACAAQARITYIPEGGDYTTEDLPDALNDPAPRSISRVAADDAPAIRQEVLADLRTHGDEAARLADVLTSDFPAGTAAVPYAVEIGTFEDEPAWIVYEAWGEAGEPLTLRRVWVFSRDDLSVLAASSSP